MNKFKEFLYAHRNAIILSLIVVSFLAFILIYKDDEVKAKDEEIITNESLSEEKRVSDSIYVDIKGAVKNPGVYEMKSTDRVIDVIKKAKIKKTANTKYLNLSKKLEDEMVIVIYTNKEINNYLKSKSTKNICSIMINNACLTDNSKNINSVKKSSTTKSIEANLDTSKSNISETETKTSNEENGLININTANKEELLTLSGIGESKANSIIAYRSEHGNFNSISEITNVSGIGESIYEKIKNYITV